MTLVNLVYHHMLSTTSYLRFPKVVSKVYRTVYQIFYILYLKFLKSRDLVLVSSLLVINFQINLKGTPLNSFPNKLSIKLLERGCLFVCLFHLHAAVSLRKNKTC